MSLRENQIEIAMDESYAGKRTRKSVGNFPAIWNSLMYMTYPFPRSPISKHTTLKIVFGQGILA